MALTIKQLLSQAKERLQKTNSLSIDLDTEVIVGHFLNLRKKELIVRSDMEIDEWNAAIEEYQPPAIVSLHTHGEWHGKPYLVLEFVEARSLQDRLNRFGPMDPSDVRLRTANDAMFHRSQPRLADPSPRPTSRTGEAPHRGARFAHAVEVGGGADLGPPEGG